jgi:hypothetical protein
MAIDRVEQEKERILEAVRVADSKKHVADSPEAVWFTLLPFRIDSRISEDRDA